jgi:hypothetical protein
MDTRGPEAALHTRDTYMGICDILLIVFEYLGSALLPVRMSWDGRDRKSQ